MGCNTTSILVHHEFECWTNIIIKSIMLRRKFFKFKIIHLSFPFIFVWMEWKKKIQIYSEHNVHIIFISHFRFSILYVIYFVIVSKLFLKICIAPHHNRFSWYWYRLVILWKSITPPINIRMFPPFKWWRPNKKKWVIYPIMSSLYLVYEWKKIRMM